MPNMFGDRLSMSISISGEQATIRSHRNDRHTVAGYFDVDEMERIGMRAIRVAGEMREIQRKRAKSTKLKPVA